MRTEVRKRDVREYTLILHSITLQSNEVLYVDSASFFLIPLEDCLQISPLILNEFNRINLPQFPPKTSQNFSRKRYSYEVMFIPCYIETC